MGNRTHGWDYWVAPTLPLKVRKAFKGERVKRWKREKVKRWKDEKMRRWKGEKVKKGKGEKMKRWKDEKVKRWKGEKVKRWKGEKMDMPINLSTCTLIENVLNYNIPRNWEGFVISVMPTQDKQPSHIRSAGQINSLAYKLVKTQQLPNTSTHQLINSSTHQLINSSTHQLINSSTH